METQGHSQPHLVPRNQVGSFYPFMVIGIGMEGEWAVMHLNGHISKRYKDIKEAFMLAIVLKEDMQDGTYEAPKRD
jgi:hypothetical protein